jgi:hypothetical protein
VVLLVVRPCADSKSEYEGRLPARPACVSMRDRALRPLAGPLPSTSLNAGVLFFARWVAMHGEQRSGGAGARGAGRLLRGMRIG